MTVEDEDDERAVEINLELTVAVPEHLRTRNLKKDSLGPSIIRTSNVSAVVLCALRRRVYVGMEHGEVFFWDIRSAREAPFSGLSPHRLVGSHGGCVSALCPLEAPGAGAPGAYPPMTLLATGSADRTIKIWDPKKGNPVEPPLLVQTLYEHGGTVTHIMRFDAFLLSSSTDCSVRLWRASEGREQLLYPAYEQVKVLLQASCWITNLSSLAESFASGKDNCAYAVDADAHIFCIVATRPPVKEGQDSTVEKAALDFAIQGAPEGGGCPEPAFRKAQGRGVLLMTHDRDAGLLLTSSWDNTLRVYDAVNSALKLALRNENATWFTGALYDDDAKQIVTLDHLGYMALYSLPKAAMIASKRVTALPTVALQRAEANEVFMVATTEDVSFWRIDRDLIYNVVRGGHAGPVISLYTCSGGLGQVPGEEDFRVFSASTDNTARLWDPATLDCLRVFRGAHSELACMTVNEAWNLVLTGHQAGELVIWSLDTGSSLVLHEHSNTLSCMQVAWIGKDLELLVTGSYDGCVIIWDTRVTHGASGRKPQLVTRWRAHGGRGGDDEALEGGVLPPPAARAEICALTFYPSLRLLMTGGQDHRVKVWSIANYELCAELLGHKDCVTCFALDGYFLFSGSHDCSIQVWDLNVVRPTHGKVERVYEPVLKLRGHSRAVTGLEVLPASGHLVSCSLDGLLLIWDYVNEAIVHRFQHPHELLCVALRFDTDEILVGTDQHAILRFPARETSGRSSSAATRAATEVFGLPVPVALPGLACENEQYSPNVEG